MINHVDYRTIQLVEATNGPAKSSIDLKVLINGKPYEFAIRFLGKDNQVTILKSPELWNIETGVFGYPED